MILVPVVTCGQRSLQDEILSYEDSTAALISKGRRLLLDKFNEGDPDKVREIKDYLVNEAADENHPAFLPEEHLLLLYWTKEYEKLFTMLTMFDSLKKGSYQNKIKPQQDFLLEKLRAKTLQSHLLLQHYIANSDIPPEQQEFLINALKQLVGSHEKSNNKTMNKLAGNFVTNFSRSDYGEYSQESIGSNLGKSNWGLGAEIFSGYGMFNENLGKNIKSI